MSPSGLDKMRRQREERAGRARKKPEPRHPRTDTGADQGEPEEPQTGDELAAEADTTGADTGGTAGAAAQPEVPVEEPASDAGDVPAPPNPEVPAPPTPQASTATGSEAGRRRTTAAGRSRAGRQQAPTGGAVVSLRGEEERKQVEVDALSWAASVRKIAEREQHVMDSIREALAAGTPVELITAALVQAEARAGASFSSRVRALLGQRRQAR